MTDHGLAAFSLFGLVPHQWTLAARNLPVQIEPLGRRWLSISSFFLLTSSFHSLVLVMDPNVAWVGVFEEEVGVVRSAGLGYVERNRVPVQFHGLDGGDLRGK